MRKGVVLVLFVLVAACVPVEGDPNTDLLVAAARQTATAQARAEVAQAATVTAAVAMNQEERAIKQAERRLAIRITENAIMNEQATATAGAATLTAGQATSTMQAVSGAATATAIVSATEMERQRTEFLTWFIPVAIFCLAAGLGAVLLTFLWRWLDAQLIWHDRQNSAIPNKFGITVWEPDGSGGVKPRFLATVATQSTRYRDIPAIQEPSVQALGPSRDVLISPTPKADNTTQELALKLVEDAERVELPSSNRIPGHREIGWYPNDWQRVVSALEAMGLVKGTPGKGTFLVGRYACLDDLHTALTKREIHIRPAPYPESKD